MSNRSRPPGSRRAHWRTSVRGKCGRQRLTDAGDGELNFGLLTRPVAPSFPLTEACNTSAFSVCARRQLSSPCDDGVKPSDNVGEHLIAIGLIEHLVPSVAVDVPRYA